MSIQALLQEYREAKKAFQEKLTEGFKVSVKELFKNVPELTAIAWTQYAPYFNDGDACVFSVNTPNFTNAKLVDDDGEPLFEPIDLANEDLELEGDGEWLKSFYYSRTAVTPEDKFLAEFSTLIQDGEMEEVLEVMFGDSVVVFVTRENITTEEYDHE